jgi:hypothetical protein
VATLTIQIELSPEIESRLAAQAAAHRMDVRAYAAVLLQQAAQPATTESENSATRSGYDRPANRKSLAQLFAESPFKGLDLDFERDPDFGRDIAL